MTPEEVPAWTELLGERQRQRLAFRDLGEEEAAAKDTPSLVSLPDGNPSGPGGHPPAVFIQEKKRQKKEKENKQERREALNVKKERKMRHYDLGALF